MDEKEEREVARLKKYIKERLPEVLKIMKGKASKIKQKTADVARSIRG